MTISFPTTAPRASARTAAIRPSTPNLNNRVSVSGPSAIVAVADVFDALISPRPYKVAWSVDASLAYLYAQRGRLFDPRCVDMLVHNRARLDDICQRYSAVSARPGLE